MSANWLYRYAFLLTMLTLVLILAGGLVTSHEAGLAVPDWPLSYGQFFPPMVGNIFWEHGHRMIAGIVGLLTLGLAIATQGAGHVRAAVKKLGWIAFMAVVLQVLIGFNQMSKCRCKDRFNYTHFCKTFKSHHVCFQL